MSAQKILFATLVAATLSSLACNALALPKQVHSKDLYQDNKNQPSLNSIDLKEVLNKTVCPIMVDYDIDENRVPRRVKVLKCAGQPSHCQWNSRKDPSHECCTHQDDHHHLECVEIRDKIIVTYKAQPEYFQSMEVPVGCSCMIHQNTKATPMPGH